MVMQRVASVAGERLDVARCGAVRMAHQERRLMADRVRNPRVAPEDAGERWPQPEETLADPREALIGLRARVWLATARLTTSCRAIGADRRRD